MRDALLEDVDFATFDEMCEGSITYLYCHTIVQVLNLREWIL